MATTMSSNPDQTTLPVLPYAGTSGWSGSEASRERAEHQDATGLTTRFQAEVLAAIASRKAKGATWRELGTALVLHHGQISSVLSTLHKAHLLDRLDDKRDRCHVYVLPEYVLGRSTKPQGRAKAQFSDLERAAIDEFRRGEFIASTVNASEVTISKAHAEHLVAALERILGE